MSMPVQTNITAFREGTSPELTKLGVDSFQCPMCHKVGPYHALIPHLQGHQKSVVKYGGYNVYKCHLKCVSSSHYHCSYCPRVIVRKDMFFNHFKTCLTAAGRPVTAAPAVTAVVTMCPPLTPVPRVGSQLTPIPRVGSQLTPVPPAGSQLTPAAPVSPTPAGPPLTPVPPAGSQLTPAAPVSPTPAGPPLTPVPPAGSPLIPAAPVSPSLTPAGSPLTPIPPAGSPLMLAAPVSPSPTPVGSPLMPAAPVSLSSPPPVGLTLTLPVTTSPPLVTAATKASKTFLKKMTGPKILMSKSRKTTCSFCNLILLKKNLKAHIQRRHATKTRDITANRHLQSVCIEIKNCAEILLRALESEDFESVGH